MKKPREIEPIDVEAIHVGERLRIISSDRVEALAGSMAEIGLKTPISVKYHETYVIDGKSVSGVPVLVTGATRLAAAKQLGWEMIDAVYEEGDEIDAQLWEIDENLARSELTTEEKRTHLRQRKALWEQKQAAISESDFPKPVGRPAGFASETAAATGLTKQRINQLLAEPRPRPVSVVKLPAEPLNQFEVTQKQVSRLMSAWNDAGPEAREQFMGMVDMPTFDRTRAGAA